MKGKHTAGRKVLVGLSGIAIAAAIAGLAAASIPSGGVISACYQKSGGTLRVIDGTTSTCASKETSLTWNQTGPQGLQGTPGLAGADGQPGQDGQNGEPGERGPSDAFTRYVPEDIAIASGANAVVSSLTLPMGSFVLVGGADVHEGPGDVGAQGTCAFAPAELGGFGRFDLGPEDRATVSVNGVVTLTAAGSVELKCWNDGSSDVSVDSSRVTAVQVGTLNDQS